MPTIDFTKPIFSMASFKCVLSLVFTLLVIIPHVHGQDYLNDRTLKLTEVSTDKSYGYEFKNPIKVGSKERVDGAYLNALKWPTGQRMHIADMQFNVKGKTGLEMVVLSFEGLKETRALYISTTEFETPKAPVGFLFKTWDDIPKVVKFPEDSVKKVLACNQPLYSIDDFLLKEKTGELPKPDKSPEFKGGEDELKKYFVANPLTDERVKQLVFRVAIAFLVSCDGKAGNFQIITKGHGDLETYANLVLAVVNRMPQNWQPAVKDGKPVDCYQVLSFSVLQGLLDKVSFR